MIHQLHGILGFFWWRFGRSIVVGVDGFLLGDLGDQLWWGGRVFIWAIDCGGVDGFLFGDLGDRLRWGWTGFYLEILLLCFVYG